MKARRLFDADATDGYLLDGKYWIDPLIAGVKTNADRIRAMTDIELAKWVASGCDPFPEEWCIKHHKGEDGCIQCWLDWLEQEAEEESET